MIDTDILRYAECSSRPCKLAFVWGDASAAGPLSATDASTNVHYSVLTIRLSSRVMVLVYDLTPILRLRFDMYFPIKVITS
jgi:hypothetical protein